MSSRVEARRDEGTEGALRRAGHVTLPRDSTVHCPDSTCAPDSDGKTTA